MDNAMQVGEVFTGRRSRPRELASDRPPQARQPGEGLQAYKAFVASLEHGSNHTTARAIGVRSHVLDRYSRRWRWPERKALILKKAARSYADLIEYEEQHGLPAAADAEELYERQERSFMEVTAPEIERTLIETTRQIEEDLKRFLG